MQRAQQRFPRGAARAAARPASCRPPARARRDEQPRGRRRRDVHAADARASGAAASDSIDEEPRYAGLHDFCMQIPYGIIILITGLVLGTRGPLAAGLLVSFAGCTVLWCAYSSLNAWKLRRTGTAYTVVCGMVTSYLTWVFGLKFRMMLVKEPIWLKLLVTPIFALLFISASMTLFCIYNVTAGGNRPPQARGD